MNFLKYFSLIVLMMFSINIFAQRTSKISLVKENINSSVGHITYPLDGTPILESRNAEVREYFKKNPNALNTTKLRKTKWDFTIGAQKNWYAYNFVNDTRYQSSFTCRAIGTHCYIFVEDSLWGTRVNQTAVDSVLSAFDVRTPANPNEGVYEMDVGAFGNPPDIDNDPRIIILILNIKDGFNGLWGYEAGYFDSYNETDLSESNEAEVYYLDADPVDLNTAYGLQTAMATTAHEFQHMINFNYHTTTPQLTFINEGCSMLAELYCGYPIFDQSLYENETNYYLFGWRESNNTLVLNDYSRAQRFFLYFWDHFGIGIFKYIVQSPYDGINLLNYSLQQDGQTLTFNDTFIDWLIANSLDDESYNNYYGYSYPNLTKAYAKTYYNPNASGNDSLYNLAADYIIFTDGRNLKITFSSASSSVIVKAIELGENIKQVTNVPLNSEFDIPDYGTTYDSVTFVIINQDENNKEAYSFKSSGVAISTVKELKWDDTEPTGYLSLDKNDTVAVTFDAVTGGELDSVRIGLRHAGSITGSIFEYNNQFLTNSSVTTPLGKKLAGPFTASISTTPSYPYPVPWPNWSAVDLSPYKISTNQPFVVAFVIPDPTTPGVMVTEYSGTDFHNSWTYDVSQGRWLYYVSDSTTYLYLIRAYVTLNANDTVSVASGPLEFTLLQNYPNPFNPWTIIGFTLPGEERVSLKVFNILGQQVADLTEQDYSAGQHNIKFDGTNFSSGIYYYTIKAGAFTQTKKMILLK
jgi:Secretion system C-terminal sorting domain